MILNDRQRDMVRDELKKLKIRYRKIRGMKDEQDIFLRLADVFAGFLRDAHEAKSYTTDYMRRLQKAHIICEI